MKQEAIKVVLTLDCKRMKNPRQQRSLLDQTMSEASWMMKMNLTPDIHDNGTVSTKTVWEKVFGSRKKQKDIDRMVGNLLQRAMEYAKIDHYHANLEYVTVDRTTADQISPLVLFPDD